MPRVVITLDEEYGVYYAEEVPRDYVAKDGTEAVMEMKASHFRNICRNAERYARDIDSLERLFIQAKASGRVIREQ